MKRTFNLSASVLALVVSGAAYAQTDTTDTSSKAPATTGGIETVVVTAERRSENLMTTPISADVFSGGDLINKGVLKVDDLQFVSPGVTVNNFGQGIDFNIRGIGKGEHNTQTLTGVITYRDGVATFPGYVAEEPYYDIQSVQILRGPQGTFVGQNATGGAVFVTSNDPVIGGGYDGYVMASIGNYTDGQLQGAVNIPVSDTFALRIAGFGEARGSFYSITDNDPADNCPGGKYAGCKPGYNPGDMRWAAGRISALWKPTESLTVSFKYDADYLDNGAYPASPNYEALPTLNPPFGTGQPNPYYSDIFHVTANAAMQGIDRFTRGILKVDYVLPGGTTLRSISGYQYASTIYNTDLDGTDYGALNYAGFPKNWTFFDHVDETIYSQEFNLISPDTDRFSWILGAFGQHDLYNFPPGQFYTGVPHGVLDSTLEGKNAQIAFAGFGQIGYKVLDNLQLQFGARYSYNRTTNDGIWNQYGTVINAHDVAKFYSFTYKGSINWQVDENNFLYAFVATGYKPGGLNPPIYSYYQPVPFDQEKVTEYETGWKATLLDGHLRTTVDGYYNRYRNFIVTVAFPDAALPVAGFISEVNVPNETKVYGFEAEADAVFGKLTLGGGLGLQHSSLGAFYAVDSRLPGFGGTCDPATGPANVLSQCQYLGGRPLTYAPSVSFNLSAQYQFDLDGGDTLTPRANFGHQSGQWATLFDNVAVGDKLAPRDILGAQLEWVHNDYVITAYGTNLTDQHYEAALLSPLRFAGAPRQYGIRIMKVF
ncbi:MAG TPA: TonB-dependent receptor [Rhizomicrobium sp.]|nr:TonB-dependent receptor [Rhizomicrobium sp.]